MSGILTSALELLSLGLYPVPVRGRDLKEPYLDGWPTLRLKAGQLGQYFSNNGDSDSIGVLTGIAPVFLADIDCDCPQAVLAATIIPGPATDSSFGPAKKPSPSHYLFSLPGEFSGLKFEDPILKAQKAKKPMLIELRGRGLQTVLPPSPYTDGRVRVWYREGQFGGANFQALATWSRKLAACSLLARYLPVGYEARLALAGLLARSSGWPEAEADKFLCAVVSIGQPENHDALNDAKTAIRNAYSRMERNDQVAGATKLTERLGEHGKLIMSSISSWLALKKPWIDESSEQKANYQAATHVETHPSGAESEVAAPRELKILDMPQSVLDGRLGEIYQSRFSDFPIAYAWPALLAGASALVRQEPGTNTIPLNLYVALVGQVHSGKTTCIERANFLLEVIDPILQKLKSGSAEGLLAKIGDQQGRGVLFFPDELSHLFEKLQIKNASFAYVLNSLFYRSDEELTIARGKRVKFNARLSVVGGIVDEKFEDAFGSATTSGLYDRFLFGQCPSDFECLWRPIEGAPETTATFDEVPIDRDVWAARDEVAKNERINPRLLEIALRAAAICAALDRRDSLRAVDLGPAWELARYQACVRTLLQPNCGKNFEGQLALKMIAYLTRHAPEGQWVPYRHVERATHAYEYGPSVAQRAVYAMCCGGTLEQKSFLTAKGQPQRCVRLRVEGAGGA